MAKFKRVGIVIVIFLVGPAVSWLLDPLLVAEGTFPVWSRWVIELALIAASVLAAAMFLSMKLLPPASQSPANSQP